MSSPILGAVTAIGLLSLLAAGPAVSQGQSIAAPRVARILDRPLVDTTGTRLRLLSDLVGKGPILMSFTFTGCQALCPAADMVMDDVAERLKTRQSGRVRLVTLTLDPLTDTPEKLRRERAELMHPDRIFLSGRPDDVWDVLQGLGIEGGIRQDHDLAFLLIGQGGGTIRSVSGLAEAEQLARFAAELR